MPDMPDLIEILESFNRKERFFLVAQALNDERENPKFELSDAFREKLGTRVGVAIPKAGVDIPEEKFFVAMDYHFDWLYAGLAKWQAVKAGKPNQSEFCNPWSEFPGKDGEKVKVVRGDPEDVDLLVAFREGEQHHLIMVEAKAYSGWTNSQLYSKSKRLREIFGSDGMGCKGVKPHFCLIGPKESTKLETSSLPDWMKPDGKLLWLDLSLPNISRIKVERYQKVGNSYERFRITGG